MELEGFNSNADASLTTPIKAGDVKKGSYIIIKGRPCKVVETFTSKTGKHGHAKIRIIGLDIFTDQKYECMSPTSHNLEEPVINRNVYPVLNVDDDDYVTLLKPDGTTKEDIKIEGEIADEIKTMISNGKVPLVTVLGAMNIEKIVKVAEDK